MKYEEITIQDTISTDRFVLRSCCKSDAGLIAMYACGDCVARGTRATPHLLPHGSVETMIERASAVGRVQDTWVIDDSAHIHAEALGLISLECMDSGQSEFFHNNPDCARVLTNCGFDHLRDAEVFLVPRDATVATWAYTLKVEE